MPNLSFFQFGVDCKDIECFWKKILLVTSIFHRFHACQRQYNTYCQSIIASIVYCRYTFGSDTNVYSLWGGGCHSFMKSTRNRAHLPPEMTTHERPHCSYPACRGTSTDLSIYRFRFDLLVYMHTKLNPVCLLDLQNYGYRACAALTQDKIKKMRKHSCVDVIADP
jgi:hypothetical protein